MGLLNLGGTMRFRKRPVVVEAEQFSAVSSAPMRGVCGYGGWCRVGNDCPSDNLHVHTIHNKQAMIIEDGDWIIAEPDGEHFYPCTNALFLATYEKVEGHDENPN